MVGKFPVIIISVIFGESSSFEIEYAKAKGKNVMDLECLDYL